MGRPTRNPTHTLARLRNQLSTDAHQVTRKELAKIAGIPQTSLRDIELGKFKMTEEVATRLSYATGVNPRSLLAGEDPLLDFGGQPLTNESCRLPKVIWARPEHREMEEQLFASVMDAARENKIAKVISFSFETWILKTIQSFGLESLFAEKLTEKLLLFDPSLVPFEFRPKDKRALKAWEDLEKQIQSEWSRIHHQDRIDNPDYWDLVDPIVISSKASGSDKKLIRETHEKMFSWRLEARKRVRHRQEGSSKSHPP